MRVLIYLLIAFGVFMYGYGVVRYLDSLLNKHWSTKRRLELTSLIVVVATLITIWWAYARMKV